MNSTNRKALVIGINRYPKLNNGNLKVAADDAEAIAQLLRNYGAFHPVYRFPEGFPEELEDLQPRVDPKPSLDKFRTGALKKQIENLFNPPTDVPHTALLFFAGHGLFDDNGELILATSEAHCRNAEWGISLEWLCEILEHSPVQQQIVWLDCCYSGEWIELAKQKLGKSNKQLFFIAATTSYEPAYAGSQHGVLTEIILKGLEPSQDSLDRLITHNKLERFIKDNQPTISQKILVHCSSDREIMLTCTNNDKLKLRLHEQQDSPRAEARKKAVKPRNKSTNSKHKVNLEEEFSQLLLTLDYEAQSGLFDSFFKRSPMAAFLIHGKEECGQSWLQHRLSKRVIIEAEKNYRIKYYKFLDLCSKGSLERLWRKIGADFSINTQSPSPEEVGAAICNSWQSETVILVFNDVCKSYEEYLDEFLREFWQPLVALAKKSRPKSYSNRLLMFFVDSTGNLEKWKIPFVELEEDIHTWEPHIPVKLPQIQPLNDYLIAHWLHTNKNKLPDVLTAAVDDSARKLFNNSYDGLHDWVFRQICEHSSYSWDKINQKG